MDGFIHFQGSAGTFYVHTLSPRYKDPTGHLSLTWYHHFGDRTYDSPGPQSPYLTFFPEGSRFRRRGYEPPEPGTIFEVVLGILFNTHKRSPQVVQENLRRAEAAYQADDGMVGIELEYDYPARKQPIDPQYVEALQVGDGNHAWRQTIVLPVGTDLSRFRIPSTFIEEE